MTSSLAPSATCLCPTRNRREFIPGAVDCFLRQTYANCSMLILADGEGIADLVPAHPRITLVIIPELRHLTLGDKRNLGCSLTRSDIICTWDDDDYSAPGRVASQVLSLQQSGKSVTGFQSMKFTDGVRWWQYRGTHDFVLGTSLCFTRDYWTTHPYEARQVGEDARFVNAAYNRHQLAIEPDLDLMYATIHRTNTSARTITEGNVSFISLPGHQWREAA